MSEPERNKLRIEAEAMSLRICNAGEMLEADESNSAPVYYQLSCIRGADADHENDVYIRIHVEKRAALLFGISRERNDIHSLEHRAKITATCESSRASYICEVRTVRVENVIRPVRLKNISVGVEVAVVGSDPIGAVKNCEEIRQQINQHQNRVVRKCRERDALRMRENTLT